MSKSRRTVRQLAEEAKIELDDALVRIWDAGLTRIEGPNDVLGRQELNRARRALSIPTRRELVTAAYWMKVLEVNQSEMEELFTRLGYKWSSKSSRIPPNLVSHLRSIAREQNKIETPTPPKPRIEPVRKRQKHERRFEWALVGREIDNIRLLQPEEVEAMHYAIVKDFANTDNPVDPPGVKNRPMLESAVFRPHTANGGYRKYGSIPSAGAALLHSLTNNHAFHNGNKRTALVALIVFLNENGYTLTCDDKAIFEKILRVAQHKILGDTALEQHFDRVDEEVHTIARWIRDNCRQVEKGERIVTFRELKRILSVHQCTMGLHGDSVSKYQFTRVVKTGSMFKQREHELRSVFGVLREGDEVPKSMVKRIRKDLRLDDSNGCDAGKFYVAEKPTVEDFILRYKTTLSKLGRL